MYWPFWAGGLALGVVAVGYFAMSGRLLGVSGSFSGVLRKPGRDELSGASPEDLEAAMLAATREEFGEVADSENQPGARLVMPARFGWSAHASLLVAIVVGGMLGALSRGAFQVRGDLGTEFTRLVGGGWRMWLALGAGGTLVGFGTAMAGGCTSGHGLCGTSRAQPGSLLTTAAFFGAAVGVGLLLEALAR